MSNKTIYIILAVAAVAVIYWKFFHKKCVPAMAHVGGTPGVKKKGGGGWRHRFSKIGKLAGHIPGAGIATGLADKYVGGMTGGMLHLSDVTHAAGM